MHIALDIPDSILNVVAGDMEPARAALEALALEGYRSERLSEYDVQQLLGFESRFDVHGFLKDHGAYMHYTMEDIERDTKTAVSVALKGASPETDAQRKPRG